MPQGDLFAQMTQKLKQLEEQIASLVKSGVTGAADPNARQAASAKVPVASAPSKKSGIKLDGYLKAADGPKPKLLS